MTRGAGWSGGRRRGSGGGLMRMELTARIDLHAEEQECEHEKVDSLVKGGECVHVVDAGRDGAVGMVELLGRRRASLGRGGT